MTRATPPADSLRSPAGPAGARYSWRLVRAGPIRLDGGGMFGVVPRVVWSRSIPCDEQNRVVLAHNCLLLERDGHRTIIEVGTGDKLGPKMRKIFGIESSILNALQDLKVPCESIENVVVSHLHFDHAGGLTRLPRPGETPDWLRPEPEPESPPGVKLTFPNASIFVQLREWEDALPNRSVMTRTYLRDHLDPIRENLRLIDSPPPYPSGYVPGRDELPKSSLQSRETEILPGIFVFLVPGHTWGQQAVRFVDTTGQSVVFVPDVMPTIHHAGPAYSLAYDVEPYMSMVSRRWLLQAAAENNWLLVLDHEPGNPLQRVRTDSMGWYALNGLQPL